MNSEPVNIGPADVVATAPIGTRLVVRTRIPGGFTDALGELRSRTDTHCTIETKRGLVEVALADIAAAKEVPPPPARRAPRRVEGE
ncbi:hypothetical protein [Leifsonia kafniensis]|uniref:putative acetyltransferase n=1 Tax=Leifsonia kafniensis TaxID=475957 RepID=UPI0031EA2639